MHTFSRVGAALAAVAVAVSAAACSSDSSSGGAASGDSGAGSNASASGLEFPVNDSPDLTDSPTLDSAKSRGTIRVGVKEDQPGLGYLDAITGERTGFDLESLIFCFAIGGVGSVLYNIVTGARLEAVSAAQRRHHRHRWHRAALLAPFVVLPVLLPVFGTVPLVALPANLLAAPVVGPLTVWGLVAGTVGGWTGPGIARILQLPTYALLRWVELVATTAADHPMAVDGRGIVGLLALACAAAATLRAAKRTTGRLRGDAPVPPR